MDPRPMRLPGRKARRSVLAALAASAFVARAPALARPPPSGIIGRQRGKVSWYGRRFAARRTASGEPFDPDALTMAHRALPFGALVRVTNLHNRRAVVVRVNDRGPHVGNRIADVSLGAARVLGMVRSGVVEARLELLATPTPARP
ncbi:MAG TPA: septal ring lytic transglycosylase RlpA family protein [Burkholderiaceae bacterium]|nr:septal ring lytic transglycosylase RlpA family protein [Burkholderiaceae bacterium]